MRIQVWKQENGLWTIMVKRTRRAENPTRVATNVPQDEYQKTVEQLVSEVSPSLTQGTF